MHELEEPPSVVTYDARPKAQTGSNRPPVDVIVAARALDADDEDDTDEDETPGRVELLRQAATVAGYAVGGAALFQLGAWVVAAF